VLLLLQVQIDLVAIYKLHLKEEHIMYHQEIQIMVVVLKAARLLQVLHQIIHLQEADQVLIRLQEVIVLLLTHLHLRQLQPDRVAALQEVRVVHQVVEAEVHQVRFLDHVN
jgi:hypothetical protein